MSGTSLDGVDGVLADFSGQRLAVLAHASKPLAAALRDELLALNQPGANELHRAALAANGLVGTYANVVSELLYKAGRNASEVTAIGAHGQTVRHRPQAFDGIGYTVQLNNPARLAELTGIDVVADFRNRDVAAGGQGAPLVPLFHQSVFGRRGATVAVLNLGGMANLTVIGPDLATDITGFDCGPGNVLLDHWCQKQCGQRFDAAGAWAASGRVNADLLATLLAEPFFQQPAPKSTGRDLFNPTWLAERLLKFPLMSPVDSQATLAELTASACADCVTSYCSNSSELIVCGGGAFNDDLMARLQALLPMVQVSSSDSHGLPALEVEAAAFAWLARKTVRREPLQLQKITGARGERVLGAIYPA